MWTNQLRYVIIKSREVINLSSVTDYQFKKFQNTTRQYAPEETFNLGMNFTDAPVETGAVKFMLNFDLSDDGVSLKPRAGVRTTMTAVSTQKSKEFGGDSGLYHIGAAYEYYYYSEKYVCILFIQNATNKVLIGTVKARQGEIIYDNIENTETLDLYVSNTPNITARITEHWSSEKIHGLGFLEADASEGRSVGTQAWNGDFYFFATDSQNTSSLYHTKFDENTKLFIVEPVTPTQLTALEVSPNKFNMLLKKPYEFVNSIVAGAFVLQGILCYQNNEIVVSPRVKTKYDYKLAYTVPSNTKYEIKWEWKDYNGTSWTSLKTETVNVETSAPAITCSFASPVQNSLMRVTVTKYNGDVLNTYPDQVLAVGINCDAETQKASANASLKTYDLGVATGMCFWQNRLVLWGYDDPIIFASDTNLPEWFPYPNNTDLFEEPVIHCEPYLDSLLVFTTQKLYKLTMLTDGSGWTKTCIQDHLYLTELDAKLIQTVKNMVFFKSGNSYYMVVPSATTAAGLTIAPIGKPIQSFLDNFQENIADVLRDVYSYVRELRLGYCFSYVDYNDIIVQYIFRTTQTQNFINYLNFCLVYDTENRTWRTHIYETHNICHVLKKDATKNSTLISFNSGLYSALPIENSSGDLVREEDGYRFLVELMTKDSNNPKDFFIPLSYIYYPGAVLNKNNATHVMSNSSPEIDTILKEEQAFLNYQYLDTGFRTLEQPHNKKRYREFQLRINNKAGHTLNFGTSFYIDEDCRRNMYKYSVVHDTNPISETYKNVLVVPEVMLDTVVQGNTILGETQENKNAWTLDHSLFSDIPLVKVRVAVSGKGYHNKLKLISTNETNYELLSICWVFKYKNLR